MSVTSPPLPLMILFLLFLLDIHQFNHVGIAGAGHVRHRMCDALLDRIARERIALERRLDDVVASGLVIGLVDTAEHVGEDAAEEGWQARHTTAHDRDIAFDNTVVCHHDVVVLGI